MLLRCIRGRGEKFSLCFALLICLLVMTEAVLNRDVCLLEQRYYGENTGTFTKFYVEWLNLPPPLIRGLL